MMICVSLIGSRISVLESQVYCYREEEGIWENLQIKVIGGIRDRIADAHDWYDCIVWK